MPFLGSYITDIDNHRFLLVIPDKELRKKIRGIGGKRYSYIFASPKKMIIYFGSNEEMIRILQELIEIEDIYFMHWDHSWPPSAIAELYRERGLIHGKIRKVVAPNWEDFKTYVD